MVYMIIKKSVMRNKNISNYGSLADYIVNEQTDGKIRNVAMWTSSNYDNDDLDLFIKEVALVQQANTISNDDKTYHLIVSFRESELNINKLKQIEEDIAYGMGFEKHQRLCVVHNDTDNLHFHIAINKINPETNKIYTPYRDYQKLNDIAIAIENKYGLIKDNHIKSEIPYTKAQDIEKSGYMQSMQSYIQNIDMDNISSWQDFHKQLNEYGIMFLKKGAGAVFANEEQKIYVKASNVNRDYSLNKLEEKFGKYEPYNYDKNNTKEKYEKKPVNDDGLYNDYHAYNKKRQEYIKNSIEQINDKYDKKLDTDLYKIKSLLNKTLLKDASRLERLIINKTFNKLMKNRKEKIYKEKRSEKMKLYKDNPYLAFNNWVRKEALAGNNKAKDFIEKQISRENYIIADFREQAKEAVKVTKNGTFITAENKRFRNNYLNVTSDNEYSVLKNLEYYNSLFPDKPLEIAGTNKFKEQAVNVIAKYQLNIKFKDDIYQSKLQQAILNIKQEEMDIINQFNLEHNNKMFSYKHIDYKEKEYEFRGFMKHDNTYFIVVKSLETNTFYIKEPDKDDYKKAKGLEKSSSISFDNHIPNNNLILNDFLEKKEETKLKYEPLQDSLDIEKLNFQGVRKYQNKIIYLYEDKDNNRIYTKIATKKDLEQYRKQENTKEKKQKEKQSGVTR